MLDRAVIEEFLDYEFEELEIKIPKVIKKEDLVEDDYYEWLKDNFKSFFNHGNPDWKWIRDRIRQYIER